jgi:hypothetical protein
MPVRRYKHVESPKSGISDHFLSIAKTDNMGSISQKIMEEIWNVRLASFLLKSTKSLKYPGKRK